MPLWEGAVLRVATAPSSRQSRAPVPGGGGFGNPSVEFLPAPERRERAPAKRPRAVALISEAKWSFQRPSASRDGLRSNSGQTANTDWFKCSFSNAQVFVVEVEVRGAVGKRAFWGVGRTKQIKSVRMLEMK